MGWGVSFYYLWKRLGGGGIFKNVALVSDTLPDSNNNSNDKQEQQQHGLEIEVTASQQSSDVVLARSSDSLATGARSRVVLLHWANVATSPVALQQVGLTTRTSVRGGIG